MRRWLVTAVVCVGCGRFAFNSTSTRTDCATAAPNEPCFALQQPSVPANYEEAKNACALLTPPSRLAAITNEDENAVAVTLAATIPFPATQTNTNQRQRMWLGGNSMATIGVWIWDSGVPFDYQNWRPGEPGTPESERCLILLGSQNGLWDDRPCETAYEAYLCERD